MSPFARPVLVSGAGVGIGLFCAELLAERGARVFMIERDVNRANAVAMRSGAFPVVGDVANQAVVERAVNGAVLAGGGLSLMIHAIRLTDGCDVDAIRAGELGTAFQTHVASLLTLGSAALRAMQLERRGLLVRVDTVPEEITASVAVLRAAQDEAWVQLGRQAAVFGIEALTVTATPDEAPVDVGTRVIDVAEERLAAQASTVHDGPSTGEERSAAADADAQV